MFPPANRQVATKGLAIVQVRADNRGLEISAGFHRYWTELSGVGLPIWTAASSGSSRTTPL